MLRGASWWRRKTALIFLSLYGGILALHLALRIRGPYDTWKLFCWSVIAVCIIGIPIFHSRLVRELDKLAGQIEDKASDRLARIAYGIGIFGYVMVMNMLLLTLPH